MDQSDNENVEVETKDDEIVPQSEIYYEQQTEDSQPTEENQHIDNEANEEEQQVEESIEEQPQINEEEEQPVIEETDTTYQDEYNENTDYYNNPDANPSYDYVRSASKN